MLKQIFITIAFFFFYVNGNSQNIMRSSLNSFGGIMGNDHIRITQTVGQSGNHTVFKSQGIILSQGYQQNFSTNKPITKDELSFIVYPNPNRGNFKVVFKERLNSDVKFRITTNLGKIWKEGEISAPSEFSFHYNLTPGIYYLHLQDYNGKSGTVKLIIIP